MTDLKNILALVREALPLSDAERDALLGARCPDGAARLRVSECLAHADAERRRRQGGAARPPGVVAGEEVVPGYVLLGELGQGGMGTVLRVHEVRLNRQVALKILRSDRTGDALRRRFLQEARAAAALKHRHIVTVYEAGECGDRPYFTMELLTQETLKEWIAGRPSPRQMAEVLKLIAEAVAYAHKNKCVHRDLKPANVLRHPDGTFKVADFGLARLLDAAGGESRFGAVMGTPAYMAPEQAGGRTDLIDGRTDVYALGAILYEMLTGRPPFVGGDAEVLEQVHRGEPIAPHTIQPNADPDLETLCLKCLEKRPEKRFQSAQELVEELTRYLNSEPTRTRPTPWWERSLKWGRRHPVWAAVIGATALLLGSTAAYLTSLGLKNARLDAQTKELADKNKQLDGTIKELDQANKTLTRERDRAQTYSGLARTAVARYTGRASQHPRLREHDLDDLRMELLRDAKVYYQKLLDLDPADEDVRAEQGRAYGQLAMVTRETGSRLEAIDLLKRGVAIFDGLRGGDLPRGDYREDMARLLHNLGELYHETGQVNEAEKALNRADGLWNELLQVSPPNWASNGAASMTAISLSKLHEATGRFRDAESTIDRALALYGEQAKELSEDPQVRLDLAGCHIGRGELYLAKGRVAKAKGEFEHALALIRPFAEKHGDDVFQYQLGQLYDRLGRFYMRTGEMDQAERAFYKAVDIQKKLAKAHPSLVGYSVGLANSSKNLSRMYAAKGRFGDFNGTLESTIDVYRTACARQPENPDALAGLADSCQHLAEHYRATGLDDRATVLLDEAVQARKKLAQSLGQSLQADRAAVQAKERLADSYLDLGNLLQYRGELAQAEQAFKEALTITEGLARLSPSVLKHKRNLAALHHNLGNLHQRQNLQREAATQYDTAIEMRRALATGYPEAIDFSDALANSLNNRAVIFRRLFDYKNSIKFYADALELWDRLDRRSPELPQYRGGAAMVRMNLGNLNRDHYTNTSGRPETYYLEALETQRGLVRQFPWNIEYKFRLAATLTNLGILRLRSGELEAASGAFGEARQIHDKLVRDSPGLIDFTVALGGSCCNLGNVARDQGDLKEAVKWYTTAIKTLEPLRPVMAQNAEARQFTGSAYLGRAQAWEAAKNPVEAVKDLNQAARLSKGNWAKSSTVESLRVPLLGGLSDYDKARVSAAGAKMIREDYMLSQELREKRAEESAASAVKLLATAQRRGYFANDANYDRLIKEPDLDILRGRDDFKAMLAEIRKERAGRRSTH
jgi:serine/threonine-protein kinase